MVPFHLPSRDRLHDACVGLLAVLILAALPLLAANTFSAPAAQTMQPVSYLPLVKQPPYRIAFVSSRDGNDEIYVMNADGSNQTRLTHDPPINAAPAWSPDGRQLAFISTRDGNLEIYVMNADGSNPTNLTKNIAIDYAPVWSPQ